MLLLPACSFFEPVPEPLTLQQRVAQLPSQNLPLDASVTIRWGKHGIPHVLAETDRDLLFSIGLLQAHLRLTQMEVMRRASQGRLSEMAGPFASDVDYSLRILNFGKAADEILEAMPQESRELLQRYVDGINTLIERLPETPKDFRLLGLKREAWTPRDAVTLNRLFSSEVNWIVLRQLLSISKEPEFSEVLRRMLADGNGGMVSFKSTDPLGRLFEGASKIGSNSIAVSGSRGNGPGAMIASDPHVGFSVPNLWIVAAYHSPSIRSVGLTFPGFPFILLGRNERIGWGGTNGWTLTSSLYDVSRKPLTSRRELIRRRWWFDRTVDIRESFLGPVMSDAPLFNDYSGPPFSLKWVGHEVSDEFTAFLRVNRAGNWPEFREAFNSYAVSGQNFLYGDSEGNIGQILAARAPVGATAHPMELVRNPDDPAVQWRGYRTSSDLGGAWNPSQGFLVSANNRPADDAPSAALFYASGDRFDRLTDLLESHERTGTEDLMRMQMDVYSASSHRLCGSLAARITENHPVSGSDPRVEQYLDALKSWNGRYDVTSKGAYAFELLRSLMIEEWYPQRYGERAAEVLRGSMLRNFLEEDLKNSGEAENINRSLKEAFFKAVENYDPDMCWGDVHRLELKHVLSRVPILGRRYVFARMPVSGSSSTVMKTAHEISAGVHAAHYGSVARHVSDLSNPDENYFVLLGGEDGWPGSENFLDQKELWENGLYVKVPLTPEGAEKSCVLSTKLEPAS